MALEPDGDEMHSAFYSPVPTTGNPTEILANRFSAWRKFLKDLIVYFREVQNQYEQKHKNLLKISNLINNTTAPSIFMSSGGINDALEILRNHHKAATIEANRAKSVENDVVLALTGLRSDLQQKIKEIKNLSGDFKNSVEKEMENTRRTVQVLGEALGQADVDPAQMTGKQDPYLLRLAADRQLERQIDEENYLHQVCEPPSYVQTTTDMGLGLPESRKFRARARVNCRGRDSEGIQCTRWHSQARG